MRIMSFDFVIKMKRIPAAIMQLKLLFTNKVESHRFLSY